MQVFTKTRDDELEFNTFLDKMNKVVNVLTPYANDIDLTDIRAMRRNFKLKTEDFFREDRKLNIGIIGRVKAGKSLFLDTFLFAGKDILPKAVTPKTATLTRIEYSSENSIEVEYYTDSEWSLLKEKARAQANFSENIVAREILEMVDERDINPYEYTKKGVESIEFNSYDTLMNELNQYVGENGLYTPLVKAVTLYVNIPELKEISIVDTPGISDPITSRTDKTKQFIELCDVVFFLSKATGFFDKNDIDLFMEQLPKKGVKKLALVCSRFDDGLRDVIWSVDSLEEAIENVQVKLMRHAHRTLDNYKKFKKDAKLELLEQCGEPIFISSLAYNMANKEQENYTEYEQKLYNDLNAHNDLTKDMLKNISNMSAMKVVFNNVLGEKEKLLESKSKAFVSVARGELKSKLFLLEKNLEYRINYLKENDRDETLLRRKELGDKINSVQASIENIFGELFVNVELQKSSALRELRSGNRLYSQLTEKEGKQVQYNTFRCSTAKWFAPWTWGDTKKVLQTHDIKYYYIDASEAVSNLRKFVTDASNGIEAVFTKSVNVFALKGKLYNTIVENFGDDVSYLRLLVEQSINAIKLPIIGIDCSNKIKYFSNYYSGEIKDNDKKIKIKTELAQNVGELFDEFSKIFSDEIVNFRDNIEEIKKDFTDKLLKDLYEEYENITMQHTSVEAEIDMYKDLVNKIRKIA